MARNYYPLRGEGAEYRLRLTVGGQRSLRARFGEDTLQTVLLAAGDTERMCALLTQALNWPDSGNPITDGEQLYDLLVDWGWSGQEQFGALAFELAAASGLITQDQAGKLKQTLHTAMEEAFTRMDQGEPEEERPFPEDTPQTN